MSTEGKTNLAYEFGPFRLDPAERLLLRDGQAVALTPKAFDLLVYLVEHHGHLVEKQSLMTALWPDTVVEEANLAYNVSALRKALANGREDAKFIETVPTRGYRFVAPVRVVGRAPADERAPEIASGVSIGQGAPSRRVPHWKSGRRSPSRPPCCSAGRRRACSQQAQRSCSAATGGSGSRPSHPDRGWLGSTSAC